MPKTKFWNAVITNPENVELMIYGDIVDEEDYWFGSETDVAPVGFAEALNSFQGKALTLRINSNGGSVFAAHAIHNLIKAYKGKVTCVIDGIAASAATIIAMAADKIVMPANSMMMIHDPMVCINGPLNAEDMTKLISELKPIKDSIIAAYKKRCSLSVEELDTMMKESTWLTASECLKIGFCDKVTGAVNMAIDGEYLVVNSIRHKLTDKDMELVKNKISRKEDTTMNQEHLNLFAKIANALGFNLVAKGEPQTANDVQDQSTVEDVTASAPQAKAEGAVEDIAAPQPQAPAVDEVAQAVQAERQRIADLEALDNGNELVHSIINHCKTTGATAESISAVLNLVKDHQAKQPAGGRQFMQDLVNDRADAKIDKVNGQPGAGISEQELDAIKKTNMVNALKRIQGGK